MKTGHKNAHPDREKIVKLGYAGIIKKYGSYKKAARAIGVSRQCISNWAPPPPNGKHPVKRNATPDPNYPDLPPRAAVVLVTIKRLMIEAGGAPPMRDIATALGGISTNAVECHLKVLEKHGYVTRPLDRYKSCRIRLTEKAGAAPEVPREAIDTLVRHAKATAKKGSMLEWAWDKVAEWLEKIKP
jgi:DNA-binding HxlR family transcriptional regulator